MAPPTVALGQADAQPRAAGTDGAAPAARETAPGDVAIPAVSVPAVPQARPPAAPVEAAPSAGIRLVERPPAIHYLPDESGRLVPVPGFAYRDFLELLELKAGLPVVPRPPQVVIERVAVEVDCRPGEGERGGATTVRLELRQTRDGWVDVPLGFAGLFLAMPPAHEGPGRFVIDGPGPGAEPHRRGYRGWVDGAAGDLHVVTLSGHVGVDTVAGRERFLLDLPGAAASSVAIRTERDPPTVATQPPGLPPRVTTSPGGERVVVCEGLGGRTRFSVGTPDRSDSGSGVLPQVTTDSVVRIDGRGAAFDTSIRIDPFPAEEGTVRVVLPPRCTPVRLRDPAVLERVEPAAGGADETGTVVEARVARRPDGSAVLEMECERPVDPSGRIPFEALGFVVADVPAWRQKGRAALVVAGEWQLDWDDPTPVRRVDPAPAARQPGFVAAFAYDAWPATLPIRVRPRASRVVVEPEYRYTVGATRIGLDATFRIAVRGAAVSRLVVALDGWTIDEAGPAALVDAGSVAAVDGTIVIPFLQPLVGDAVVEVRAARPIERSGGTLSWALPQPRADLLGPATVTVAADADIEVLPDAEGMRGLVRRVVPAPRRGVGDRPELVYRLEGTEGTFAATRRVLPRRVEAALDARVGVGEAETTVDASIRLDVANAALESIDLVLPAGLSVEEVEVLQGGQSLAPFELPRSDASVPADGSIAVRALLAQPLLGEGTVVVRTTLDTPPERGDDAVLRVPLVLPRGARIVAQTLLVGSDDGLVAEVRGDGWRRDAVRPVSGGQRAWVAAKPQDGLDLSLAPPRLSGEGETVVEAAWLETRLFGDRREEVCTYVLSSAASRLELALPPTWARGAGEGPERAAIEVQIDGTPVPALPRTDGTLVLDLPPGEVSGRRTSLLRIRAARAAAGAGGGDARAALGVAGPVILEAPRFAEGTLERRFFWEVLLPDDEHVVAAPDTWTSQQRWTWWTGGLRREPVVSRAVLGEWIDGTLRAGSPRQAVAGADAVRSVVDVPILPARAVFAGTGTPGRGTLWLVPTWLLVLAVSGPILAVGLAMVYRPGWRRLPAVFALVVPALLAAVTFPALAPLVLQAALPGLGLSLLAAGLRRVADRPGPAVGGRPATGSSIGLPAQPSLVVNVGDGSSGGAETTLAGRGSP